MRLLYPCDPFNKKEPDETYAEEFLAAQAAGLACSLYSAEDFESGEFKPRPLFADQEEILYRGWMLDPNAYGKLLEAIECKGARVVTSVAQYRLCHHLPEWYPLCKDLTPETIFVEKDADYAAAVADCHWPAFFVKDYVKSLTTNRGSVANSVGEIAEIVSLIEKYRGQVEGGVCIRQFERLAPDTEERYFVFRGKPYGRNGAVPEIVQTVAPRISSPFFSVDVVLSTDGTPRLIELGDGQVSDRKQWPVERFLEIFRG
ncbi:MAG: ATP-grasp domain-containing protein [Azonexus sp.]